MASNKTLKKLTRVGGDILSSQEETTSSVPFEITEESKSKAKILRIIAVVCWVIAIGVEIGAIIMLKKVPINMTLLIVLIVVDLLFAVAGSMLWKKANRLDPASEKDSTRYFIQNQLGMIIAVIAFLPLVVLIFTNKNMSGKQKGILGTIAVAAMAVAGLLGTDFNPPSQEKYSEERKKIEASNRANVPVGSLVYWTKSGKSYHLYQDCSYINTLRTDEIFEGTIAQAKEMKNITDLCDRCEDRAAKEKGLPIE